MNIAFYIHHPEVEAWRFTAQQVEEFQESVPNDRVLWVTSEKEFLGILPETEAAVVWRFEENWFSQAPKLRWIATPAAGQDHLPAHPPEGVQYSFGRFHGILMSETVLGMMLSVCRNLHGWSGPVKQRGWPQAEVAAPMRLLAGSRVLLCGFGPIGQAIGYRLKQHHVHVTVIRRQESENPAWMDSRDRILTAEVADRENLWATADHVVLALPGGKDTRHFLSKDRLDRLSSSCWVYNVGRGSCMDEASLIQGLEFGRLGGAFLDVFEEEPLPEDSPLRTLPNVHLLPHVSAVSAEYLPLFLDEVLEVRKKLR